jgi:5-methylcytosine-specific restriction endonuclease McrA
MSDAGAIRFAEKVVALMDEGRFASTYKYAVLLALLDLSLENVSRTGDAPDVFTTRQLADKVIELYWPHAVPFGSGGATDVLLQNGSQRQAAIVRSIQQFRVAVAAADPTASLVQLRQRASRHFERLTDDVEWRLIEMPLPRVQNLGNVRDDFIYEWDESPSQSDVRSYQRGRPSGFDNRIRLRPGVGRYLIQLNALLRPLIQRHWAAMVARLNRLEEARLERFLFGADRTPLNTVRSELARLQAHSCFYCRDRLLGASHVDHFIPWSRYPEDGLANLVVAHERCNLDKRDFLPATSHVVRWAERLAGDDLPRLQRELEWDAAVDDMRGVARGIYLRLPEDAMLWIAGRNFGRPALDELQRVLGT